MQAQVQLLDVWGLRSRTSWGPRSNEDTENRVAHTQEDREGHCTYLKGWRGLWLGWNKETGISLGFTTWEKELRPGNSHTWGRVKVAYEAQVGSPDMGVQRYPVWQRQSEHSDIVIVTLFQCNSSQEMFGNTWEQNMVSWLTNKLHRTQINWTDRSVLLEFWKHLSP